MIVCVGAGGVGKTTVSAAIAVAGARAGKRVACLTIDPAKRLADSLGVGQIPSDGRMIDVTSVLQTPSTGTGTLHMGMLDAETLLDELIRRHAASEAVAQDIMRNNLYKYVSGTLGGVQEYLACERLNALRDTGQFDLIVIDTPPSENALDFFTAPARIQAVLDGPIIKMMGALYRHSRGVKRRIANRWAKTVFGVFAHIAGTGLLAEMGGFVESLSGLFAGIFEQSAQLEQLLKRNDVAVSMITTPDRAAVDETHYVARRLARMGFVPGTIVFNKCHYPPISDMDSIPESPDRAKIRDLNHRWNRTFEKENDVIQRAVRSGRFDLVLRIPLSPTFSSPIVGLDYLWETMNERVSHRTYSPGVF